MTRRRSPFALPLVTLLATLAACGSNPAPTTTPVAKPAVGDLGVDVANLNAQLPPYLASLSGGSKLRELSGYVLVAQHDQVLYGHGFGFADRAKQRIPTAGTSFRIGSVTKQFTAAAILRLEQDGKLAVTDKVSKHLPDYPGPGKDVTIHQLLTHAAGIPSYTAMPEVMERRASPFTVRELLATFWDRPLDFPPGSKFSYSNSGYAILGAIIERASGMPYAQFLQQRLFRPAGLDHTEVGDAPVAADRAEAYRIEVQAIGAAAPIDMSVPFAAGAVRSTADDLVRWHRALSSDAILSAAERAKLYQPEQNGYAYGWAIETVAGHPAVSHNGGIDGFGTSYWRIPDADLVVVAWTNVEGVMIDGVGKAAVEAALGGTLTPEPQATPGTVDRALIERLAGTYQLDDDSRAKLTTMGAPQAMLDSIASLAITPTAAGIELKPAGQPAIELGPTSDGSFYNADHAIRIRFTATTAGPIQAVTLQQRKLELGFHR